MEVASAGEIRTGEPAALDLPTYFWLPAPSPQSCVHHQAPHLPRLLRLWRRIRHPKTENEELKTENRKFFQGDERPSLGGYGVILIYPPDQPRILTCELSCSDTIVRTCHA